MVTPFNDQLEIEWSMVEQLVEYLIVEQQSDSLVISGTTGESPTLTDEEKLRLFETAVRVSAGRAKIIAGTGSNDTAHSVHLTKEAEKVGVDGVLLVAPYYNRPTQEGLYRHFKAIASQTKLPVILYNVPKRTGSNISAETTIRLSRECANIVATKEAHDNIEQITNIIKHTPEHFLLYSGDDETTLPVLAIGGHGVISVVSHIVGREIQQMVKAFFAGNVQEAARLHGELMPIFKGMFLYPNPVPIKYALTLRGKPVGGVRLPLVDLSEQERSDIRAVLGQ